PWTRSTGSWAGIRSDPTIFQEAISDSAMAPELEEGVEHESAIANPREPVVPVASPQLFGQGGPRSRRNCAGWRVHEVLEGKGAPFHGLPEPAPRQQARA